MDDRDFLDALSGNRFPSKEAAEYFSGLRKTAGVKDFASQQLQKGVEFVSKNKLPLAAAVLTAAAAGGKQYLDNKPGKSGKSKQREQAEKVLGAHENMMKDMAGSGKTPSYSEELSHARAKARVDVSKVMEKHPGRGAAMVLPVAASLGFGIGKGLKKLTGG